MTGVSQVGLQGPASVAATGAATPYRNMADIILELGLKAMDNNEIKMNEFYSKIEENNRKQENYNNAMAALRKDGAKMEDAFEWLDPATGDKKKGKIGDFLENEKCTAKDVKTALEDVKSKSDSLGNVNTQDMTRLQSVINKQNEMSQLVSNNMSKFNQMAMAIIGNLR